MTPSAHSQPEHYRFNFTVNVIDGAFFGFALGSASFVAVLPLFVNTLTDSATLIGLIPAIHTVGWQLPQLLTANRVARLARYKPMVLAMTVHERLPFFGLALLAWFLPSLSRTAALTLTFILLVWQGLGGGVTATAWQSMIGKIIPPHRHGLFFGIQASAANLTMSVGSVLAGLLLENVAFPGNYAVVFFLGGAAMAVSWVFLALTRESPNPHPAADHQVLTFRRGLGAILRRDANFRWFVLARILSQFGAIAFAFYTVYAVNELGMGVVTAGLMAGVFSGAQILANPLLGWIGDRWGHRNAMAIGALAASLSALLAWWAPSVGWFYPVFALAGVANVALWTIVIAMTLEFGTLEQRPAYIGLANTLVAPFTFLAPLIGGRLADAYGYPVTFWVSAAGGLAAFLVFQRLVRAPVPNRLPGG